MKINDKSLRGIFLYDPLVEFERGDFVIEDSMIYNCIADSVGESPLVSPNFTPYMAGNIATAEEILEGNCSEKFVSVESLVRILDNYYSGFSAAGLINNDISDDGEVTLRDMLGNRLTTSLPAHYTNPLDKILYSDINNGIFKVERSVVDSLIGSGTENVILRQYTYKEGDKIHKTQELIDEERGRVMFRHLTGIAEKPSPWKFSIVNTDVLQMISEVINYYDSKVEEFNAEKTRLTSCFRFQEIDDQYLFKGTETLTFTVKENLENGILSMHSATITVTPDGTTKQYQVGPFTISITCGEEGKLIITGAEVVDKYVRKRYTKL